MKIIETDICVIGGGSGGLSVAAGAVQMGARVVLCEGHKMGGDCLNYGCVPSKSIIEASRSAANAKKANKFGVSVSDIDVDFGRVNDHIISVIKTIYKHDSVERFERLGVQVIEAYGELISRKEVQAGDTRIKAKYIVLATGSRARIFPTPGIDQIEYYTNETIFDLREKPEHLVVVGGGPIGSELAQAYSSLGVSVSIIEMAPQILGRADAECIKIVRDHFVEQGINIYEDTKVLAYRKVGNTIEIDIEKNGTQQTLLASHVLMATGRIPNLEKLGLSKGGIKHDERGI